jgi:radical SAM superfamily enzyme YgiQ (UPF0313 family)
VKNMHRGYSVEQIRESLSCLTRSGIPFLVNLLFGAPGETQETINETLSLIDSYHVPNVYVTVGISLWTHHQQVYNDLRNSGQLPKDENLFDEMHYISPELPKDFMVDLIHELNERENYTVQVFKPFPEYKEV